MSWSYSKTWANGEVLTHTDLNNNFADVQTNFTPTGLDDYSANVTQMRATNDPYPGGAESLATSVAEELTRLRYVIAQITGQTYWYLDPTMPTLQGGGNFTTQPTLSGTSNHITTLDRLNNTAFDVLKSDNDTGTYYTVGPTGSGADIIWSDLDAVPTGARFVKICAKAVMYHGTFTKATFHYNDSNNYLYGYVASDSITSINEGKATEITIPLDANKIFKMYYQVLGVAADTTDYVAAVATGYMM